MSRFGLLLKRFSSTITVKPTPSKTHHHVQIPDSHFPRGFIAEGRHCGVKKNADALDLAIILSTSPRPTSAAACFTRNAFLAAPVLVSQQVLEKTKGRVRGLVVNSGCANAVTGKQGMEDAWAMVRATDRLLPRKEHVVKGEETLVMSTGVIGQVLPISKIISGIQSHAPPSSESNSGFTSWERAAKAFMTTDTFPKLRARTFKLDGKEYRMTGIDKGAGMIHPNMGPPPTQLHATLLACILTDAPITPRSLQSALTYAVERSFNSISVDGDMSTNDTIVVLANGAAADEGQREIDEESHPEVYESFKQELTSFAAELAQLVVRDGEGATKFVTVSVDGAASYEDAHKVASSISTSALVKTALFGEDANWGRILAATGSVPLSTPIDPSRVSVSFVPSDGSAPLPVLVNGEPENVDEERAKQILVEPEFEVQVNLGGQSGSGSAKYWTCDFSYEYVRINGDYRS